MYRVITLTLSVAAVALVSFPAQAAEPANLYFDKQKLIQYYNSGSYEQDIKVVVQQAEYYLQQRVAQNQQAAHPQKLAIVLDIDETALSNYADMRQLDFGGTVSMFDADIQKAHDVAIKPVLALYRLAEQDKVAVFFITGRKTYLRKATEDNLKSVGYTQWNDLSLKPVTYNQPTVATYKIAERQKIEREGYDIVLNMGDQYSDLKGAYADKTFKLPNPYYYIP